MKQGRGTENRTVLFLSRYPTGAKSKWKKKINSTKAPSFLFMSFQPWPVKFCARIAPVKLTHRKRERERNREEERNPARGDRKSKEMEMGRGKNSDHVIAPNHVILADGSPFCPNSSIERPTSRTIWNHRLRSNRRWEREHCRDVKEGLSRDGSGDRSPGREDAGSKMPSPSGLPMDPRLCQQCFL